MSVICPRCGGESLFDTYCSHCNAKLIHNPKCHRCESLIYEHQDYCSGCGLPRRNALNRKTKPDFWIRLKRMFGLR